MADVKEKHYWEQLQGALTAGQWDSPTPARTPKGGFLSWTELFRKFKKHTKRVDVAEAAIHIQFLSLLLRARDVRPKDNEEHVGLSSYAFDLESECLLNDERRIDLVKALDSLQEQRSGDGFVRLATAYIAYAVNRPSECLERVTNAEFAESLASIRANGASVEKPTVLVTHVDEKQVNGSLGQQPSNPTEIQDGKAWILMQAITNACLEGMAHERLAPGSPSQALAAYEHGVLLLQQFAIPKSAPNRPGRQSSESFTKYRELWQWTDRLLWRAIVLSAQHKDIEHTIPIFRTYTSHSVHWPATFQAAHRTTICSLYLRALLLLAPSVNNSSDLFQGKTTWTNEMRNVINEYRAILSVSTHFPSAGERNVLVEEFVDYCVAAWETSTANGDQAGWVIDILWWATRLTFNSPRVYRHMARLLHVSGDNDLAKRVLRLYVQVVKKARETGTMNEEGEDTHDPDVIESDLLWVRTLIQGARMLCRIPGEVEDVKEAITLVDLARERVTNLGDEVNASLDLADGICKSALANRGQEPSDRGPLLSEALSLLTRSIKRYPTPSAYFHAALIHSRPTQEQNLEKAIEYCRKAVEDEHMDVRHWHLLVLLESKLNEWKKARGVLEAALEIADDIEARTHLEEMRETGIVARDYQSSTVVNGEDSKVFTPRVNGYGDLEHTRVSATLVDPSECAIPAAATLLGNVPDHPPPSQRELFEHVLELRMTQLALIELMEGPEAVEPYWLDVFEWYSQRRETNPQSRSAWQSIDTRLSSSPAFNELDRQETAHSLNDIPEGSTSTALTASEQSDAQPPSIDTTTIRSTARTSIENSTTIIASEPLPSSSPQSRGKEKEKTRYGQSPERDKRGKRVQQMLKNQVHKQSARINTISKKIGHGVTKGSIGLHRSSSAPDFHAVLTRTGPYQASSIHSRRRLSFSSRSQRTHKGDHSNSISAPSPPPPPLPSQPQETTSSRIRNARERKLLSDLWLMSAATFRRLEKLDQARGAIQEAETLDEENVGVWVQLGLYFAARGEEGKAVEAFQKALLVSQDDCIATMHLCHLYLTSTSPMIRSSTYGAVDLAAGMLEDLTRGVGWDVPEAWYLLAKACDMQGRRDRERECLVFALGLAEVRGVRDIGSAIGWCL